MQQSSLLYCPTCGAANALDQDACFACRQPLALAGTAPDPTRLVQGRYQVLTQVGAGGFGAVYKALDTGAQGQLVAIKQINLRGLTPQEMIEATDSFNREVRMLSALSHAHLPRIHAHFTDPDHWYVVMDFIEGETLEHYLRDITSSDESAIRSLMLDEILEIGLQLCSVLTYLHMHQPPIIFRDLKPANIMRTPQGQLYLIDFGIARYYTPGQARDTIPLGSPGYAPPEQYGRAQTTPQADIYSLGALLHHLLSLHDPSATPFTFAPLGSHIPGELSTLVLRMVEQDVARRPAEIGEVASALLRLRGQLAVAPRIWRPAPPGQVAPVPLAPGAYQPPHVRQQIAQQQAARRKTRRKFLVGGLSVASALALGGSIGGLSYWRYWHPARLAEEGGFPWQLPQPASAVSTIAWSPDGQQVAFGFNDGTIMGMRLSNRNGWHLVPSFSFKATTLAQPITLLAWAPDASRLAAVSQPGQVQVWDLTTQKKQDIALSPNPLQVMAWSPDGQSLAAIDNQGKLYLSSMPMGAPRQLTLDAEKVSNALAWSPDSQSIAAQVLPDVNGYSSTSMLQIWDAVSASETSIPVNAPTVKALAWSPDGTSIAALSLDGTLQVWNGSQMGNHVFSQQIPMNGMLLAWSPDSRFLTTIDYTNNLLLLDKSSGNTLVATSVTDPFGRGGVFPGQALTWLPDNQHIAVASSDMECWLWSPSWF